jgi:creatinine amidohydrolase
MPLAPSRGLRSRLGGFSPFLRGICDSFVKAGHNGPSPGPAAMPPAAIAATGLGLRPAEGYARGMKRSPFWADLSTADFSAPGRENAIAVLPVAAVEQHGPHLPAGTDLLIMEGCLARAVPLLPAEPLVLILPVQAIGKSDEHLSFPGTLTLSPETAIAAWTEIGESVARAGIGKLVIVSSHGGNSPVVDIVARRLRLAHRILVVQTSWARLGYPEGLFSEAERRHGIHAGEIETSLMLAFRPDLVRMEAARDFTPRTVAMAGAFAHLAADRPAGFAWLAEDIHPAGAMGNAAAATAAKGEAAAAHGARAFAALIAEVARFELFPSAPEDA